eukprot:243826-Chlamydomonas_euryale.AAC.4
MATTHMLRGPGLSRTVLTCVPHDFDPYPHTWRLFRLTARPLILPGMPPGSGVADWLSAAARRS